MKTGYSFGSLVSFTEALNAVAVKTIGDQTIGGIKTFTSNPISSATQGTGGSHLTRKDYVDTKAPIASPAFTGVPTAPTAPNGTSTTQIATTAFVTAFVVAANSGQLATVAPLMDGVADVGSDALAARQDHIHPTDTTRAPLTSPAFTGVPTAPTAATGTSTNQLATTAFVANIKTAMLATVAPLMDGIADIGNALSCARQDHIHPTDTSRAPLTSPAFIGTPTAPTAATGTSTTQLATTAFVAATKTAMLAIVAPLMDGIATVGSDLLCARQDHVHPTDTTRAPLASPAFTGIPTAPTPAQFSADAKIATMEAVQRALGSYRNYTLITTSTTLNASHVGHVINISSGGITLTLPLPSSLGITSLMGQCITVHAAINACNINAASNVTLMDSLNTTITNLTIPQGCAAQLVVLTANIWRVTIMSGMGVTPTVGDSSTKLATTEFVANTKAAMLSTVTPLMNGVGAVGDDAVCARQDHIHPTDTSRAPLASPTFTGTPAAPTAAAGTNTTQLATTAFVTAANTAQVGTATPLMDGIAAVGSSTTLSRQDHVHASDTTKANLASPTFTGVPTAPTAAAGTNTTQLATTAFVTVAIYNKCSDVTPLMNGAAAIGTSTKFTREDHVHPTDTSRAPLASPSFTGTVACTALSVGGGLTTNALTVNNNMAIGTSMPSGSGNLAVGNNVNAAGNVYGSNIIDSGKRCYSANNQAPLTVLYEGNTASLSADIFDGGVSGNRQLEIMFSDTTNTPTNWASKTISTAFFRRVLSGTMFVDYGDSSDYVFSWTTTIINSTRYTLQITGVQRGILRYVIGIA